MSSYQQGKLKFKQLRLEQKFYTNKQLYLLKRCCKCKKYYAGDCFHKNRTSFNGLDNRCKYCIHKRNKSKRAKEYNKQYYQEHQDYFREYQKVYQKEYRKKHRYLKVEVR